MAIYDNEQKLTVKHRLPGFFMVYLISTLPGVITGFLISLLVLFFVGAAIVSTISGSQGEAVERLDLRTVSQTSNSASDKILIYNLNGIIQSGGNGLPASTVNSGIYTDIIKADFEKIKKDDSIKNIVFKFDSPGGEVFASQILGDEINKLIKEKNVKKAGFYFDSISASGALLAAYKTPNYVVASPYGETGSIGVRLELPNVQKLADNIGYKSIVVKSGPSKDIGSIFRDPTSDELKYFQGQVDKTYEDFVNIVANGRNLDISKVRSFSTGLVYFNNQAKDLGLVDELGELDIAVTKAASEAGIGDYKVVEIRPKNDFLSSLSANFDLPSMLGLSKKAVDGLNQIGTLENGKIYAIDERKF